MATANVTQLKQDHRYEDALLETTDLLSHVDVTWKDNAQHDIAEGPLD
jgi:hypothetical protein